MHQTTVRFGGDLWRDLEAEAGLAGVSVAQFIRDSALARVVYSRARRGDDKLDAAFDVPDQPQPVTEARAARDITKSAIQASTAVQYQGEQARRRARELREQSLRARQARSEFLRRSGG
jgi:hypothetical protein